MHIAIIINRSVSKKWGGDYQVLRLLEKSFNESQEGDSLKIYLSPSHVVDADIAFIAGLQGDVSPHIKQLKARNIPTGRIPFYEDRKLFTGAAYGLLDFFIRSISGKRDGLLKLIDWIKQCPEMVKLGYLEMQSDIERYSYYALREADLFIASSELEKRGLNDICPKVDTSVIHWQINSPECNQEVDDEFLKLVNLPSKGYLLQVGRVEFRKNQLSTIAACKDLDIPLVFIATQGGTESYERLCLACAKYLRKAPTYFVGGKFASVESGNVKTISVPSGILPYTMILSALKHAKLHVMPSFFELPGLVYFEAMQQRTHSIIGRIGAWEEYLTYGNFPLDKGLKYMTPVTPYDIGELEVAIHNALDIEVPPPDDVPILNRDFHDLAEEFKTACQGYLRGQTQHCTA